jgi:phytoene desaturase
VAVIGGGLGGLTAAGLLAREGFDVTVFEAGPTPGGKAQVLRSDGLTLDTGPTLLTLPHLVRQTFEALGAPEMLPRLMELPEQCVYRFPDGCDFTAYADLEKTARSAGALRPSDANGLRRFYAEAEEIWKAAGEPYLEAPFEGMPAFMARVAKRGLAAMTLGMKLGTLDELARKHFRTTHLRQFAGRFATYAGASPYEASAAFAMIPHLERAFGVFHVEGGMGALARALCRAAERQGAKVRLNAKAEWGSKGAAFEAGPRGEREPFDAVVVNADPLEAQGRSGEPLALSGYVLLLEADTRLPLAHHTVLFSQDYRREFDQLFSGKAPDDPTVYLCHPAATDPSMAPEGRSGLFVMANAPATGDADRPWADAARLREKCLGLLDKVVPGTRLRVLGERTPSDFAKQGAPGGSIYGFLPHGRFGPFRRPKLRGDAPGLFFAGGGTHPGGGVPLVMLSGRFAAGLVREHLGSAR